MSEISVIAYQSSWPREYAAHVEQLLPSIRPQVARIDHIGSTSIPGLAAKDIIDIQIALPVLTDRFAQTMIGLGYRYHPHLKDNAPLGVDPNEWQKQVFTEPVGVRRLNIHVRRMGAANMRQALLFRDYLRAHPISAAAHGLLKQRLAKKHPEDRAFYYEIKDAVSCIVQEAAENWAKTSGWHYDHSCDRP